MPIYKFSRRDLIALICSVSVMGRAQAQAPSVPVVGLLGTSAVTRQPRDGFVAVRQGLAEQGFVVGANVAFDLRGAEGHPNQLPAIAADLVGRGVAVLMTAGGREAAFAAKSATSTTPIVFTVGEDPAEIGLVASLAHPGGNATGVTVQSAELVGRRPEILHELVPQATAVALLIGAGPLSSSNQPIEAAANHLGLKVITFRIDPEDDFEAVFASIVRVGARGLLVELNPSFTRRRAQIVALASRYRLPALYPSQEFAETGGWQATGLTFPKRTCRRAAMSAAFSRAPLRAICLCK